MLKATCFLTNADSVLITKTNSIMKLLKRPLRLLMLSLLFCLPFLVSAQKRISGTIRNASDNSPVVDASVSVKGTSIGTTTDQSGTFSIEAREGQTLVLSSVGFET